MQGESRDKYISNNFKYLYGPAWPLVAIIFHHFATDTQPIFILCQGGSVLGVGYYKGFLSVAHYTLE
jgi:hypothetical protein